VKVWLKACQQNHPLCKFEPASPPTRLVELVSEAHGFRLRLVETLTSLAVCQYVTLSYCWGVDPFLRLTRENYASFVEEIPLAELPKTLSDAVIFAKMLQIRFIWIDALCIIQDSPEDWAHEAASMSDVYSGGLLNISAVASESVNGGLFRFRNPLAISPFLSGVGNEPSGNFERVYVSGRPYEEYHNNPLSKRGWCLQERLLAQRTVHFTHTSIVWECNECTEPEASLSSLARFALKPLEDIKTKQMMVSPSVRTYSPDKQDITSVQKLWHDWKIIVSLYAATQLTYQKDKLVAISGVARRFEQLHSKCGGDYLAGLWQADLISGLLWSTYDETLEKAVRHKSNTAPSWSWASVDGPIHWERNVHYSTIWQASIFEASTNTDGDDFSGPISDGIVSIRGPLGMASLSKTAIVSVLADRRNEPAYPAELNGHTVHGTSLIPDDHSAPALEELQNTTLYLLGLSESKHNGQSVNQRRIEGLLLTPDRAKTGRFSRVGYFKYQKPDTAKGSKTRIDDFPLASLSKHLYEQYHARLDGENQYTIRIC